MPNDYFHLVPAIRDEQKYFDISLAEIVREVSHVKIAMSSELVIVQEGVELTIPISLRASKQSVALLLHDIRFDCIDHEARFEDCNGEKRNGWHRHVWDGTVRNCEKGKIHLPDFADDLPLEEVLRRSLSLMSVVLNADDNGNYELQWRT